MGCDAMRPHMESANFPIEITNFDFKLGDMGLAKTMKSKNQLNETFAGTPISMAPEVVNGS